MADLRDQLQDTLGTTYRIERELGGGGMSRVFVATETALGRQVVVKVLPPEMSSAVSAERFKREVQLAARLRHPHIVPLLSAGDASGLLYYTMPLVEGEPLRTRLARGGALSVPEAVRILREVADALGYAHEHGVVHRDIKPENILVERGHAVVADFGVAKALSAATLDGGGPTTATGVLVGTPLYMAPEQASGDPATDHRADLYALGVLAYELLCGAPPFGGRTPHEVIAAHLSARPAPIGERRPGIPPALAALVMRCLAKDPAARPQSADEVLRATEAVVSSGGGDPADGTLPAGAVARSAWLEARMRHARAHRGKYVAAVLLLALLLAVSGVAVTSRSISRRSALNPAPTARAAAAPEGKSVAVLPFANVSADADNEYFSAGLTEELLNALTKVPALRVRSAIQLKGEPDARAVGQKLGVQTVLGGSVRKGGTRLRISTRLTDVATGDELWAETYDRELADVFAVQEEIARAIAGALRVRLAGARGDSLVARPTENVAAYDLYLRGRHFWDSRTKEGTERAIQYFQRALAQDSTFARAYAGLADSYINLAAFYDVAPKEAYPKARAAALKALALDSTLAEAHASLGYLGYAIEWNWQASAAHFRRSIQLNPGYATAHLWYAWVLPLLGRTDEAVAQITEARDLEPLSPIINTRVGTILYFARRHDEAIAQLTRTVELDTGFFLVHRQLGDAYVQKGMLDAGIAELQTTSALAPGVAENEARLGYAYARAGRRAEALAILDRLQQRSRREYVSPVELARIAAGLGDTDRAMAWLERGYQVRATTMPFVKVEPMFDPLRADPRFARLLRRMELAP